LDEAAANGRLILSSRRTNPLISIAAFADTSAAEIRYKKFHASGILSWPAKSATQDAAGDARTTQEQHSRKPRR
jgi:hypothetical protein